MVRIEWEGPPEGEKSVEHTVSYSIPVASALRRYSSAMAQEARQILEVHRDEGDSKIEVVHRDGHVHGAEVEQWLDSVVQLIDVSDSSREAQSSDDGNRSAAAVEAEIGPLKGAAGKMIRKRRLSIK